MDYNNTKKIEEDYKQVWTECLEVIKDALGPENKKAFDTWFVPIVPLQLENSTLLVQVPSPFFYEWYSPICPAMKTMSHENEKYVIPV